MTDLIARARELCERAETEFWYIEDSKWRCGKTIVLQLCDALEKAQENVRLMEAQRWIAIEECKPDSGVHVLLCCETRPSGRQYVCDGYYAAPKTIVCGGGDDCETEYDDETDEYYLAEGYCEIIKNWDDFSSICINDFVTHWRPLPAPPQKGQP